VEYLDRTRITSLYCELDDNIFNLVDTRLYQKEERVSD